MDMGLLLLSMEALALEVLLVLEVVAVLAGEYRRRRRLLV